MKAPLKPPALYPAGVKVVYRRAGASGPPRLAGGVKRISKGVCARRRRQGRPAAALGPSIGKA
jgi:hypothetical protein